MMAIYEKVGLAVSELITEDSQQEVAIFTEALIEVLAKYNLIIIETDDGK